jgi:hypothetical protein
MGDRYRRREIHANVDALLRRPLASGRALLGHNGGPPLDWSGEMFLWRRAMAQAWKTPPREIALMRLNRAEQLGLSYRAFAAVLMDRGRWLNTIVFSLSALAAASDFTRRGADAKLSLAGAVVGKFAALRNADILVLADPLRDRRLLGNRTADDMRAALNAALGDRITGVEIVPAAAPDGDPRADAVAQFLRRNARVAADAFMVGNTPDDLYLAEQAGLSLFLWADEYFTP